MSLIDKTINYLKGIKELKSADWRVFDALVALNLSPKDHISASRVADACGISLTTLFQYIRFAKAWPPEDRVVDLPPRYYYEVPRSKKRRAEAIQMLRIAKERKMSRREWSAYAREQRRGKMKQYKVSPNWRSLLDTGGQIVIENGVVAFKPYGEDTRYVIGLVHDDSRGLRCLDCARQEEA